MNNGYFRIQLENGKGKQREEIKERKVGGKGGWKRE